MCCQCCFQNITWSHQLIKGKNSACTLPMCVMKRDSRIIHVMICLKQYWQLKTLITILSQYTHSDTHGLMNQSHSTQGKTCQQVYSRGHKQDIVWLKLCTSISMFIVHQSVWNICTHTAYNVHKTHNKSLSSRDINSSGGGESPCLSSWSMTLQDARGDSGVCGTASDVRAGCRGFPGYVTGLSAADRENLSLLRKLSADFQSHI